MASIRQRRRKSDRRLHHQRLAREKSILPEPPQQAKLPSVELRSLRRRKQL